jgi:hypothetical protein
MVDCLIANETIVMDVTRGKNLANFMKKLMHPIGYRTDIKMIESWFKVNCQARITKAIFDFDKGTMEITGYIDFDGPEERRGLLKKEFTHSWSTYGDDFDILEKILADKCGKDLMGPEKTMSKLREKHK